MLNKQRSVPVNRLTLIIDERNLRFGRFRTNLGGTTIDNIVPKRVFLCSFRDFLFHERRNVLARKISAVLCWTAALGAYAAAAYCSYMAYIQRISYQQGILTFIPLFIVSFWFGTFFSQLAAPKSKSGGSGLNKHLKNVLSVVHSLIGVLLLGFWVYLFISRSLYKVI